MYIAISSSVIQTSDYGIRLGILLERHGLDYNERVRFLTGHCQIDWVVYVDSDRWAAIEDFATMFNGHARLLGNLDGYERSDDDSSDSSVEDKEEEDSWF